MVSETLCESQFGKKQGMESRLLELAPCELRLRISGQLQR